MRGFCRTRGLSAAGAVAYQAMPYFVCDRNVEARSQCFHYNSTFILLARPFTYKRIGHGTGSVIPARPPPPTDLECPVLKWVRTPPASTDLLQPAATASHPLLPTLHPLSGSLRSRCRRHCPPQN